MTSDPRNLRHGGATQSCSSKKTLSVIADNRRRLSSMHRSRGLQARPQVQFVRGFGVNADWKRHNIFKNDQTIIKLNRLNPREAKAEVK